MPDQDSKETLDEMAAIKSHNAEVKNSDAAIAAAAAAKSEAAKIENDIHILEQKEEETRRQGVVVAAISAIIFTIIGLAIYLFPYIESSEGKSFTMRESETPQKRDRGSSREERKKRAGNRYGENGEDDDDDYNESDSNIRKRQSPRANIEPLDANAALPAAPPADPADEFRDAIARNQNDITAWRGLLEIYRDSGNADSVERVENLMSRVFGGSVVEITDLVSRFGVVTRVNTAGGIYRIEYRTEKQTNDDILTEVFSITRAVRNMCNCDNTSIFASAGMGRGLMANSQKNTPLDSRSAFARRAELLWIE